MIPMKLNNIIMWCGGSPFPPLEDFILPLARRDLDPLIKSPVIAISNDHKQQQVRDALVDSLFSQLPEGWKCQGRYRKTPHLHLTFNGPELNGTFFQGHTVDVFICIATSRRGTPDNRRSLYVRHMPIRSGDRHRLSNEPFNKWAAWLSLYVWGTRELHTSWKASHDVEGYITLEGEVLGSALA